MAVTGSKYEETKGLRTVQVAALIRADIKAAVAAGELPAGKYSVRSGRSGFSGTIDVTFRLEIVPTVHNIARLIWIERNPHASFACAPSDVRPCFSPRVEAAVTKLEEIVAAYNRDNSDLMSDYYDRRFYEHVAPCPKWVAEEIEGERSIARDILADEKAVAS